MRVSDAVLYLTLRRGPSLHQFTVSFSSSIDHAIGEWDWTTRSSPIFPLGQPQVPDLTSKQSYYFYFVGPLDPGLLDLEDVSAYATLGTYNLFLVVSEKAGKADEVQEFLDKQQGTHWERWEVTGGVVTTVMFSASMENARPTQHKVRRAAVALSLASAEEENSTLLAASIAKASLYFPKVSKELVLFADAFRERLENSDQAGDNVKLSWLVNANAHLSRYSSQAFSGVTPIMSTECHFWSHSLLGIGTACQALVNIRRFAQEAVGDVDWIDALDRLGTLPLPPNWVPLIQRNTYGAKEWFDLADAVREAVQSEQERARARPRDEEERLPLIVCFSGRDGFRSTPFSMTAPLEVISGANTYGWTPMTMSHEICHVWLSGILETIFPDVGNAAAAEHFDKLLAGDMEPATLLDEIRIAFYVCYHLLYREELQLPDTEESIPPDRELAWPEVVERFSLQVNETLTHVLDYQFFYQQDEERYVRSIWSSWDVIPNIKDRLTSYLIRSSCALLSERINHDDAVSATIGRLRAILEDLQKEMPQGNYLTDAIAILYRDEHQLAERIGRRALLVRLAKSVFANREIAARLEREHQEPGGPYNSLSPLEFDYKQIWNPLRFVTRFSVDRDVSRAKSLWILTKIAFMQDPHETFA